MAAPLRERRFRLWAPQAFFDVSRKAKHLAKTKVYRFCASLDYTAKRTKQTQCSPNFPQRLPHPVASIQKTAGGYRAQVAVRGQRDSRIFRTKREADAWAAVREVELRALADASPGHRHTLAEALRKYAEEVSVKKRGARWEQIRIEAFLRDPVFPVGKIGEITPEEIGRWRDARLAMVSSGTVIREMGLLSSVLDHARREWRWIDSNPCRDARKPREPDHREVVISRPHIKAMLRAFGHRPGYSCRTVAQACARAFLLALRSGMRAGEIAGLTWDRVRDDSCWLPVTKTTPREVPLSRKAMRIIESMRGFDRDLVFGIKSQTLDSMFRRYRDRAGLAGFTFHDSRHTAATWMARRVDVLTLCKVFGWKNPKMAMVYYNPKASDIARLLSAPAPGQSQQSGSSRTRSG